MSDHLENFIRSNREKFDTQVPSNQVWAKIQTGLASQAATAASSTAAGNTASSGASTTAAKVGATKLALGWKLTIVTLFTAAIGTGIYFATKDKNQPGKDPQPMTSVMPQGADDKPATTKVEYLYEESPVVKPPIAGVNVPYNSFSVNASQGGTWTSPSGSTIKVPAGIFVDAQGNPVKGKVDIRYREFHDAADIILSGITMKYNEKGAKEDFQTAGMMEILGSQGEAPVYIAKGKEISVRMASFAKGDDYNLYFLDPQTGWKDIGKPSYEVSKDGAGDIGKALGLSKPEPPVKGVKDVEVDGEVAFDVNFDEFSELSPYKDVRWVAEDKAAYAKLENRIMSHVWDDVKIEEVDAQKLRYKMTLSRDGKHHTSVMVNPILEGADYEKGMTAYREKLEAYNKMVKERGEDRKRQATQVEVYRTFTINGFGIFNCDRFYGNRNTVVYKTDFVFPKNTYVNSNTSVIFHITGDTRAVLTIPAGTESIKFSPTEENYLVVMLPHNQVAVFDESDFQRLEQQSTSVTAKIEFEVSEKEVQNASDLRVALGI
ncbi:MAG: hypothetical protein U0176_06255 [Bacteroidia bacterium]